MFHVYFVEENTFVISSFDLEQLCAALFNINKAYVRAIIFEDNCISNFPHGPLGKQ